jgi:hypothetical protein
MVRVQGRIELLEIETNMSFNQEEKVSELLQAHPEASFQSGSLFLNRGGVQSIMSIEAGEVGTIRVKFNGTGNQNSRSIEFQQEADGSTHGIIGELERQLN